MQLKKIFAIIGMFGVIFGAFGAHYFKNKFPQFSQQSWNTATVYLFIHVIAGLYVNNFLAKKRSQYCFLYGIFLFSGSLYLYAVLNNIFLAMLAPLGGILFILGWFFLALDL